MEDQIMKENSTFAYTNFKQIFLPIEKTFALLNYVKTKMGKFQFIRKLEAWRSRKNANREKSMVAMATLATPTPMAKNSPVRYIKL